MSERDGQDWLMLAQIRRPWGLRGEVTVDVHSDWPEERFVVGEALTLQWNDGRQRRQRLRAFRRHGSGWLMAFDGVDDIETARTLRGARVVARREELGDPEDGVLRTDLLGLDVIDQDGVRRGEVLDVEEGVASDLLVVGLDGGEQVLVPLAREICTEIDLEKRRITIDPPMGLLDPEEAILLEPGDEA